MDHHASFRYRAQDDEMVHVPMHDPRQLQLAEML
jgi:hypothetical protein